MEKSYRRTLFIYCAALSINVLLFIALPYFMMARKTPVPVGNNVLEGFKLLDAVQVFEKDRISSPENPKNKVQPLQKHDIAAPEYIEIPSCEKQSVLPNLPAETADLDIDIRLTSDSDSEKNASARETMAYDQAEVDQVPTVVVKTRPAYPYRARRFNLSGEVWVKFLVDTGGQVRNIQIIRADPPDVFEETVIRALSTWRFAPGNLRGRPVDTWVTTSIAFHIEEAG
jgi:protein TonB